MIGTVSAQLAGAAYSLTDMFMMPLLTSSISKERSNMSDYLISLRPSFIGALTSMLFGVYGWSNFSAIYDNTEALFRVQSVLENMYAQHATAKNATKKRNTEGCGVDIRYLQNIEVAYPLLRSMDQHLRYSDKRNVLIDIDRVTDVQALFDQVLLIR
jgi:hypothetical protein